MPGGEFYPVCPASQLKNGDRRALSVAGHDILLMLHSGRFYAVRNQCTHLAFPLESGRLVGFEIMCRQHGARFDIRDGRALGGPAVRRLDTFETQVVDGMVEIRIPV